MGRLCELLMEDCRLREGLNTCINCGTCSAICPAAEFYRYDPRRIVDTVQRGDEEEIESLLKSDTIWYCGQCMSCTTRCPRKNGAGLVVMALRNLSAELGYFVESEKGRQLYPLTKIMAGNILRYGYCIHPESFVWADHVESGPVWRWHTEHLEDSYARQGANFMGEGVGALRKIPRSSLDELQCIFDLTGATARIDGVERVSRAKAMQMGLTMEEYFRQTFEYCSDNHYNNE